MTSLDLAPVLRLHTDTLAVEGFFPISPFQVPATETELKVTNGGENLEPAAGRGSAPLLGTAKERNRGEKEASGGDVRVWSSWPRVHEVTPMPSSGVLAL